MKRLLFVVPLLALLTFATPRIARADVTSWLAIGSGYSVHKDASGARHESVPLSYSIGAGSSPTSSVVVGMLLRATGFFTLGTDLSVAVRGTTGGFSRGDWGVALDVGVVGRFWGGGNYGEYPVQVVVTGGAPWGLQLGVGADFWSVSGQTAQSLFAVLEVDLLRLTLMRQGSTDRYWRNPNPAGGRIAP